MEAKKPRPILKKIKTLIQGDNQLKTKKNSSGGKTFKSRGKGTSGQSLKMKMKTRGENGEMTYKNVIKEKGMFAGKRKSTAKSKPVEYINEEGSFKGNAVKKKTVTKAPGIFGKRTVKRESIFVETPKSSALMNKKDNAVYDMKTGKKIQ